MDKKTKLIWIDGLQKIIDQYAHELRENLYHNEEYDCPLCILSIKRNCKDCIHMNTKFGQGKHCSEQKSFHLFPTSKKWMSYRRSYIIKLRNKLIASL